MGDRVVLPLFPASPAAASTQARNSGRLEQRGMGPMPGRAPVPAEDRHCPAVTSSPCTPSLDASSLTECWHPLRPVGDSGPATAPQDRERIRGVRLESAGGGQFWPVNPEALPALSWARRPHAKMEHGRLPLASWGGNRGRLSEKCTQLGCADDSMGSRQVVTPTPLRKPPAGSIPQP